MGIRADIFTRAGAELDGVETVTLVEAFGEPIVGPFEPDERAPAVVISWRQAFGESFPVAHYARRQDGEWAQERRAHSVGPMFNGRFIWSSDGRFRRLAPAPVPLHDRWETPAEYATYD